MKPLGKPKRRWEDNITVDIIEIIWEYVYCIHMALLGTT